MCGIFGIIGNSQSDNTNIRELVKQLFLLSESRGKEASGFAYTNNNNIVVYKTPEVAHNLIQQVEFKRAMEALTLEKGNFMFIGHSRLATNGSQYIDINNQPTVSRNIIAIHNGIVVNAFQLWCKYFPHVKMPELDTQVLVNILDLLLRKGSVKKSLERLFTEIIGETSVAIISNNPTSLILKTNTGSIYYANAKSGIFVFSSERYITEIALRHIGEQGQVVQLKPGDMLEIPLNSSTYNIQRLLKPMSVTTTQSLFRNSLRDIKSHIPNYNAIEKIPRCANCILPTTMPLISFDKQGICNFCNTYMVQNPTGKDSLESFIKPFRSTNGEPDCIVALSGGRDSSYGLHYAKTILGLNPIAYTYDWGMVTDVARRNQSRLVSALGVEHIWVSANIDYKRKNIKKNVEAWLARPDIAMVPLFMAGDKQAEYYVEELKKKTGIKLVIYCRGNQLEDERFKFGYYGIFDGTPKGVIHNLALSGKVAMAAYFAKACIKNPRYINSSLFDTAFAYASSYLIPHKDFLYLWHYVPWKENEIVSTLKTLYEWETPSDTVATWRIDDGTPPFYNYIYYHVQGFTEHDGLRSNQIREGHISRKDALQLVFEENKPRYESLKWYFDIIGIDGNKALSTVDKMQTRY